MTILKGAAATALYGSRAASGVVMITTKTGKRIRVWVLSIMVVYSGLLSYVCPNFRTNLVWAGMEIIQNLRMVHGDLVLTVLCNLTRQIMKTLKKLKP